MHKRLNKTQRNYIIAGLCMILVIMGVGYAAFQSQLKIIGTSNITSNWNVKITDIQSKVVSGTPSNISEPTHTDTTATFKTKLVLPNDTMQYDITVSNEGDIDAKLDKITVPESNNPAIGFEVTGIREGALLKAGNTALLTVTVKYNNVTEQPDNLTADFTVTLDYSQAPNGYVEPVPTITSEDLKTLAVTEGDGLYKDEYEEGKYTYKGTNPNNYITFNNEMWRIISIDSNGLIKIMRNESIGQEVFDSENSNAWETSDIKTYLNGEYLDTITTNQDKIVPHTWSIGGVTSGNSDLAGQIASENGTESQSVSIGMITASEYLRANTNTEQCGNMSINNTNASTCLTTNWMYNIVSSIAGLWTISPDANNGTNIFDVISYAGFLNTDFAYYGLNGVFPALYLSSDITLTGEGTQSNPYTIMS